MEKVFGRIVAEVICHHLDENFLFSYQQFGITPGQSTLDMLMLQTRHWHCSFDEGHDITFVDFQITEDFDRV